MWGFFLKGHFFANKRRIKNYIPDDETVIQHVDEVLKLLSVMTGDRRYERLLKEGDGREVRRMCDVAERLEQRGKEEGREGMIMELVRDNVISVKEASARLGITEEELKMKL